MLYSADLRVTENTATLNADFGVGDLTAYFSDGDTQATVHINIIPSDEIEPTEIFHVDIDRVEGGNAVIGSPSRTDISILDHSGKRSEKLLILKIVMSLKSSTLQHKHIFRKRDSKVL